MKLALILEIPETLSSGKQEVERRASSPEWTTVMNAKMLGRISTVLAISGVILVGAAGGTASAALVTDPDDPRSWQGATVGTFAALFFGSDTLANRQAVVTAGLLDDGIIPLAGATGAAMISGGGGVGTSFDLTGTGSFAFGGCACTPAQAGSLIDNLWVQTSGTIGVNVWDLGAPATKAAIFNTIDHGPLPQEAIESTV